MVCYLPYFIVAILDITEPLGQFLELADSSDIFRYFELISESISVLLMREVRQAVKNKMRQLRVF